MAINDHAYRTLKRLFDARNNSEPDLMAFRLKLVALKISEPQLKDEINRRETK